jgi:hypothetical protein
MSKIEKVAGVPTDDDICEFPIRPRSKTCTSSNGAIASDWRSTATIGATGRDRRIVGFPEYSAPEGEGQLLRDGVGRGERKHGSFSSIHYLPASYRQLSYWCALSGASIRGSLACNLLLSTIYASWIEPGNNQRSR